MMASRYSVRQSSSVAGVDAGIGAPAPSRRRAPRSRHRAAASTSGSRCVAGAGAVDQQRLGRAADARAAHLGVQHDAPAPCRGRPRHARRHGRCPRDARRPARAPPPARARRGSCRRAARSRRCIAVEARQHGADRGAVARRHELDGVGAAGRPLRAPRASPRRSPCAVRKLSEPARRIAALPAFRQSAPASAVTLGRLSKMTPIDAERRRDALDQQAVRPLEGGEHPPDGIGQRGDAPRPRRRWPRGAGVERSADR